MKNYPTNTASLFSQINEALNQPNKLPPVHLWNPDFCGDMDIIIKRDGSWFYMGTSIQRKAMVKLFSTVLRKEGDRYYLVTPVEKVGIQVEDAPFTAVVMEEDDAARKLSFLTNVGDVVELSEDNPLTIKEGKPYIEVRNGLHALISRAIYFDLVERAVENKVDGIDCLGVYSCGSFFSLGEKP